MELISGSSLSQYSPTPSTRVQTLALIMASMLLLGVFFTVDIPAAVQNQLIHVSSTQHFDINSLEYSLFYSVYSIPNIIVPLVGGYMVDSIGVKTCIVLFCSISLVGQAVFSLGVALKSYYLALAGRAVLGLGGENILGMNQSVAESTLLSQWFKGKYLALALGIDTSFARLGTVANFLVEPVLYSITGDLNMGMVLGVGVMGAILVCGFILLYLDKFIHTHSHTQSHTIRLKDIFSFSTHYWLCNFNCFLVTVSILAFTYIATEYYETRFQFSDEEAGFIIVR